jgi:mono/diheme cytochrome c family protein
VKLCRFAFICLLLFACVALAQNEQKDSKQQDKKYDYIELGKAPEKYRQKANPMTNDPEAVTAGKLLFEEHCGECHGDQAEGSKRAPSLRAPEVQNAAPGAIFWILSNGIVRKRMPVWSKLPEPQRWQLVSFIKSLGTDAPTPAPSTSSKP